MPPDSLPTTLSARLQILVWENRQLKESSEFDGPVELGRQRDREERLYARRKSTLRYRDLAGKEREADGWRWVIAGREETTVSRNQAVVEPVSGGMVYIYNASPLVPIRFVDQTELMPNSGLLISLPVLMVLGTRTIRLQNLSDDENPDDEQGSLAQFVFAPFSRTVYPDTPADQAWLLDECKHLAQFLARGHLSCAYPREHYTLLCDTLQLATSAGHALLAEGFHRVVCFDARKAVTPDGEFRLGRLYRHALGRLVAAFDLRLGSTLEPEDLFQLLRDEQRSLLCFLSAGCIPEAMMYRVRSFTQERHAVLLVRPS